MFQLVFVDSRNCGQSYTLAAERTTIGRHPANGLVIRDGGVSRTHCEILVWKHEIIIRDLGSRNGTLVNGRSLRYQQAPLHAGDLVQIGLVKARLEKTSPRVLEENAGGGLERAGSPLNVDGFEDPATSITAINLHREFTRRVGRKNDLAGKVSTRLILEGQVEVDADGATVAVSHVAPRCRLVMPQVRHLPSDAMSPRASVQGHIRFFMEWLKCVSQSSLDAVSGRRRRK